MIIAITGGIGSGKSSIMNMLKADGYNTLSADEIYNDSIQKGLPLYYDIKNSFPDAIDDNQNIDKRKLASIVFSSKQRLEELNCLSHAFVMKKIISLAENAQMTVAEIPLLFESGLQNSFDCVILICASYQTRIKRVMQRSGLSRDEVVQRISSQIPQSKKIKQATYVVYNEGKLTDAYKCVKEIIDGRKNI